MYEEPPVLDRKLFQEEHVLLTAPLLIYTQEKLPFPVPLKNSSIMPELQGFLICWMIFAEKIASELSWL